MDESRPVGNRRSRRSNVLLAASVEAGGTVTAVKLRNLSAEGALIEGAGLPLAGSPVLFRRNDLAVHGRIAWIKGKQAGVAFDEQLEPQAVLRNEPRSKAKLMPRPITDFRRPGLSARPLTLGERHYINHWIASPPAKPTGE